MRGSQPSILVRTFSLFTTKVAANAGKESLKPCFFVEAHLNNLFGKLLRK